VRAFEAANHDYLQGQIGNPEVLFFDRSTKCVAHMNESYLWCEEVLVTRSSHLLHTHTQGEHKPNKKFYDPRNWMRKSEEAAVARLGEAFADLNSVGVLA